jgi:uncharacterized membrane protein
MRMFIQCLIAMGLIVAVAGPLTMLGLNDVTQLVMGDAADNWRGQLFSLCYVVAMTVAAAYSSHKLLAKFESRYVATLRRTSPVVPSPEIRETRESARA